MTSSLLQFLLLCPILVLLQVLAALPWLSLIDPGLLRRLLPAGGPKSTTKAEDEAPPGAAASGLQSWKNLLITLGGILVVGFVFGFYLNANRDEDVLEGWGRVYGAIMQLQLSALLVMAVFFILLKFWTKGGAVALSAFREGVRQPLFWVLTVAGVLLLGASPFLPYFTFGEDLKMLKDLAYITIMFMAALFGVLAASMSISEEIEGRTAITVMSKPVSRRNFILGKFLGILMTGGVMTAMLGWLMIWIILFKQVWDPPVGATPEPDPSWVMAAVDAVVSAGPGADLVRGIFLWAHHLGEALPGLVITFCQVMVLLAVAVALATRLPMVVNVMLCLIIYFLGHLTPILTAVSRGRYRLIEFVAGVFDTILPGLDLFDMGPAVVRYSPLDPGMFGVYTVNVTLYAVTYTAVALLFGLILFEDRDLA